MLAGRTREHDLPLDGEHLYPSTDGCGVFARDRRSGEVRASCKRDVADAARVVQALEHVSVTSAVVSAQDCPPAWRVLHEFDACLRNSAKHSIVVSIKEDWEARHLIEMARAVAGGAEELRRRPVCTAIICTVSPLHQERFGMDLALTLAEAGIPVSFYPMPILGATAPATVAGAAVVNNAELLSAVALVQLAVPGAKVIHGGGPTAMSMASGAYRAAPRRPCCCARSRDTWPTSTACRPGWAREPRWPRSRGSSRPTRTSWRCSRPTPAAPTSPSARGSWTAHESSAWRTWWSRTRSWGW